MENQLQKLKKSNFEKTKFKIKSDKQMKFKNLH